MSNQTLSITEPLYQYILDVSLRESPVQQALRERTRSVTLSQMQIAPEQVEHCCPVSFVGDGVVGGPVVEREQAELERREQAYRGDRAPLDVSGRIVILVDDGMATGATMRAAIIVVRRLGAARIVVAVPTALHFEVAREADAKLALSQILGQLGLHVREEFDALAEVHRGVAVA